jgi:multicomponent Na+:H+ antiporter subunit B
MNIKPMSLIIITLTKTFSWFIILFGTTVILNGHNAPGGAFQGGAIVATFVCLMLAAFGSKKFFTWANAPFCSGLMIFGLLAFFMLACFGLPNSFAYNFLAVAPPTEVLGGWLPSSGTISLMNIAVGFMVIGALSLTVITICEGTYMDDSQFGGECGHDR